MNLCPIYPEIELKIVPCLSRASICNYGFTRKLFREGQLFYLAKSLPFTGHITAFLRVLQIFPLELSLLLSLMALAQSTLVIACTYGRCGDGRVTRVSCEL